MTFNGAFRERLRNSWVEMRENLTRSILQSLGVILGVAAVLGGFSISDSMRRRSMELYVKMGGLDKLNVRQSAVVKEGAPTALQMAIDKNGWTRISVQATNQKWSRRLALRRRIEPKIRTRAERTIVVNKPSKFISPYFALRRMRSDELIKTDPRAKVIVDPSGINAQLPPATSSSTQTLRGQARGRGGRGMSRGGRGHGGQNRRGGKLSERMVLD